MKRTVIKLAVSLLAFVVGVSVTYLLWMARSSRPAPHQWASVQVIIRTEIAEPELKVNERRATSIEQEWKELTNAKYCLLGRQDYSPGYESENASSRQELEGPLNPYAWLPSLRKDVRAGVAFLIKQLPDKSQANVHVCPFDTAQKGELAVYCLQHILKVNWYELQETYKTRYENINYEYSNNQALLRRILRSKKGAQEMMRLWTEYFEQHAHALLAGRGF